MIFDKTVKNITRIGEVINILIRFGFDDIIANTPLAKLVPRKLRIPGYASSDRPFEYNRWERIRMVIEELGTTFIKLAQILSNRPDILPHQLIKEFSKLRSNVPPFSTIEAKKIIEKETGKKISELFSYFDNRTIGSGSVAQVHRARLIRGEDVVVKVQRPEAADKVHTDLILLREFIKLTETYFHNLGILNPLEIVETFEETMNEELDFRHEAQSMSRFRHIYDDNTSYYIPKAYKEISSTKVLVIEFAAGCEIDDIEQMHNWGIRPNDVAEKLMDVYLEQIFVTGYFHADPHPGNILIRPNKQIILIDFGMTGRLTRRQKYDFAGISLALANRHPKSLAVNLRRLAVNSEVENMKMFEHDLETMIDDFTILNTGEYRVSDFIGRLRKIVYDYKLRIPGQIFLLLRSLAILEGIGRKLHPDFRTMTLIEPYARKILAEQVSPQNLKTELGYSASQLLSLLNSSPTDIKYILRKLRKGEIAANISIESFDEFLKKMDSVTNRLVLAFVISSLFLASSIIMIASPEGMTSFFGIPIASIIGFALAGFWSLWLMLYILRIRNQR